ncbi:MAG: GDSL-type esterase/lipase family protein [Verrucomicrobiota bacterium]
MNPACPSSAAAHAANTATVPSLRHDYSPELAEHWRQRHERYVARAQEGGINVLFVGDSITEGWRQQGEAAWQRWFAPLGAASFGASGDRTQQVLWRLAHGDLAGFTPKVAVLLIGTNNLDTGLGQERPTPANTPAEIVAGVESIVRLVQQHHPSARILLVGLLPRGEKETRYRSAVPEINRGLRALAESSRIAFLEVGHHFLPADGELPPALMPDQLHLSEHGYEVLATALHPAIKALLAPVP